MNVKRWLLPLAALPLLSACVDDSASYQVDGREHALILFRQQKWPWDKKLELAMVVSRLPDCQRRHRIGSASPRAAVELWQPGPGTFILRLGERMILTETQTCEGWQRLEAEPEGGLGTQLGTFREEGGKLRFVAESATGAQ